jgi:hypothetical protein
MTKEDGSGFWRLLEHFLCPAGGMPTDFMILHHPLIDRFYAFDRPEDSIPLHRAIRAFQESVLLRKSRFSSLKRHAPTGAERFTPERHAFIVSFLWGPSQ